MKHTFTTRQFLIKPILLLVLILFGAVKAEAGDADYEAAWFTATINECTGKVTVKFVWYVDDDGSTNDEVWNAGSMLIMSTGSSSDIIAFFGEGSIDSPPNDFYPNGESMHYIPMPSFSSQDYDGFGPSDTEGDEPYWMETSFYLPAYAIGETVTFSLSGSWQGGGTPGSPTVDFPSTLDLATINVTDGTDCFGVGVTWAVPSALCSGSSAQIYRDDTYLTTVGAMNEQYYDLGVNPGETHNYKVRFVKLTGNGDFNYGGFSPVTEGSRKAPPQAPGNLLATTGNCDSSVNLTWNYTSGVDSVEIRRDGIPIAIIAGTQANYTDNVPERGITYNYTLRARNECGWGAPSDIPIHGISPAEPEKVADVNTSEIAGVGILVSWPASDLETGYVVERNLLGGGGASFFDVAADVTSYLDESIIECQTYEYRVLSVNDCRPNGVASDSLSRAKMIPDLSTTFDNTSFKGSKGYFSERVELHWTLENNANFINAFKIYRKQLGTDEDSVLITSTNSGSNIYIDYLADASVLYKYTIIAETQCENSTIYSNPVETVGFRSPFGTVTGNVTYTGGIAVADVRISAESTSQILGNSVELDGTGKIAIANTPTLNPQDAFLFEAWIRPGNLSNNFKLVEKGNSYSIEYIAATEEFSFNISHNGGNAANLTVDASAVELNNYNHLAFQLYTDSLYCFLNGVLLDAQYITAGTLIDASSADIEIGELYEGLIDELRIWNSGKTQETMARDFSRLMIGGEEGLVAYLGMDEANGHFAYDASRVGNVYNRNHGEFIGNVHWSSTIPSNSKLSIAAYTDSAGNYIMNVPYHGLGESFVLTPSYLIHEFDPATRALYIGDGAIIHNSIDFEDISSFTVSGSVFYKGYSCPAKDVQILVDGNPVVINGLPAKTDAAGQFTIQVPIGAHFLSTSKPGHGFSIGRFPESGMYNFQDDLAGIGFEDSTLVKVVGRVVGGLREANKLPGLGHSINNIGVAQLEFVSQLGGGCAGDTILTDSQTGEYEVYLPPLKYIPTVTIVSDPTIDFGVLSLLDLSGMPVVHSVYDTTFTTTGDVISVDSATFNERLDFIHRVDPIIVVKDRDGIHDFIGDTLYTYINPNTGDTLIRNLRTDPFRWPILSLHDDDYLYRCLIKVFERYVNADTPALIDSVPTTDGTLVFNNALSHYPNTQIELSQVNTPDSLKFLVYSFKPGQPNFLENISIPEYSYTKVFELTLLTGDGESISWKPIPATDVPSGGDQKFRAVMLGTKSDGAQFITQGPQVPEYVLRDPPGGNSSATREINSVKSKTSTWSWNLGAAASASDKVFVGAKFLTGIGVATSTESENNVITGFSATLSGGSNGTQSVVITNTQSWSTNGDASLPGAASDLYIGKSKNVQFGVADHLTLVPDSMCDEVECLGSAQEGFEYAHTYGLSIVPGGYQTTFMYSQNQIINSQIPTLIELRNIILQSNPKYTSTLNIADPNYGKNNDDPVFGSNASTQTPNIAEFADMSGPSYTYLAVTLEDSLTGDSVRFVNNQIKQWQNAIRLNEWEKVNIGNQLVRDSLEQAELDKLEDENHEMLVGYYALVAANSIGGGTVAYGLAAIPVPGSSYAGYAVFAITTTTGILQAELFQEFEEYQAAKDRIEAKYNTTEPANYSISGGNNFTSAMTHQTGASRTNTVEYSMGAALSLEINGKINNTGIGFEKSISMDFSSGRDWTDETNEAETVAFTLFDPNLSDLMSVDVYPSILGWGPIFKKRAGGQTSCPYEGEELTQFYEPGTQISEPTLQMDKPSVTASPSILFNIPVTESAVFNLTLGNESESGSTRNYTVQVLSESNPFGAIITIDGEPSTNVSIPANSSVNKVLSVEKGPGAVYNYDSLLVIIYAPCQFTNGIGNGTNIVDSVYISARFIPTCTDVELADPEEAWVANNFNQDTVETVIAGYNINFFDLENIRFEYKPANESQWIGLETFWKDTVGLNDPSALPIPTSQSFTLYDWDISQLTDGYYDLRVRSQCVLADKESVIYSGIIDRINPHPFGSPSPADGIVSPNDEISIRFNEPVDLGALTSQNFDIRGVLNGTEQNHSTSLLFDGVDDYVEIPGGVALSMRDFTIQLAIKRSSTGAEAIFAQGLDPNESLFLGFNDADQLVFRINGQEVTSTTTFSNTDWHYIGLSYSFENETAEMFLANEATSGVINTGSTTIFSAYQGSGKVWIGKQGHGDPLFFHGNMHELRIWDSALSFNEFYTTMNRRMSGGEAGLLYNWRMDEAEGTMAIEHIRRRDAIIHGPTWNVTPGGSAAAFDGVSQYLKVSSSDVVITDEMDFTLEFWFRGSGNAPGVLFSNGSGTSTGADSLHSWVIEKDASGLLHLKNYGIDFLLSQNNYFDGTWHHLAIVLDRDANLSAIIDGNPQLAAQATPFKQLAGPAIYIGAHGYYTGTVETVESFFAGEIDEFRLWNSSRKLAQIKRDKRNRMLGNEPSLLLYLPFENYALDPTGIPILTASFDEQIDSENHTVIENGTQLIAETPTLKLQRPIEAIAFNFSVNNDEIIFTPTTAQEMIENVTLDITVSNVKDLQGNVMASPATWIAYVDKNQVVWGDAALNFEKMVGEELTFASQVVNQGGAAKAFTIENLPAWLSADITSGTIPPNSTMPVNFTVNPMVNIGDYIQDIQLLTDFNFPEKLTINLKVREAAPDWGVDASNFEYSMGIIGMLEIKDVISNDEEDILAAFVNGELRGSQHVEYLEELDRYLVFMDVYSNSTFGDSLEFKIWDAGSGVVYSEVTPHDILFETNGIVGSALDPQIFSTDYEIEVKIPLDAGWNWISQYLLNADSSNFDILFESLEANTGDQVNGQTEFANFLEGTGWVGPLENSGLRPEQLNKFFNSDADTLVMRGDIIDPSTRTIHLGEGWNWIGFISIRNQGITQALGNLSPAIGDQIKGRSQFSVYANDNLGWQGTLQTLVPGRGYMYKSGQNVDFTFPYAGMFKSAGSNPDEIIDPRWLVDYAAHSSNMTLIIQPGDSCEKSAVDAGLLLGSFDQAGIVRGITRIGEVGKEVIGFLTLSGDNGETLDLKWIHPESAKIWPATTSVLYEANGHRGSLVEPFLVELPQNFCKPESSSLLNDAFLVFPTVFDEHLSIVFGAEITDSHAMLRMYDMTGRMVYSKNIGVLKGTNRLKIEFSDRHFAAGAYVISLETAQQTRVKKIFKTR